MKASRKPPNPSGKGGFQKGQSGNPAGRRKEDADIRALARRHGPAAIARLAEIMDGNNLKAAASAAVALLDRGYGKPTQPIDGDGEGGAVRIAIEWLPPSD